MNKSEELLSLLEAKKRIVQDVITELELSNCNYQQMLTYKGAISDGRSGIVGQNNKVYVPLKGLRVIKMVAGNTYLVTYRGINDGSRILHMKGITDIGTNLTISKMGIKFKSVDDFFNAYKVKNIKGITKEMVVRNKSLPKQGVPRPFSQAQIKTDDVPLIFSAEGGLRLGSGGEKVIDVELLEEATVVPFNTDAIVAALKKQLEGQFDVVVTQKPNSKSLWTQEFLVTSGKDVIAVLNIFFGKVWIQKANVDMGQYRANPDLWPFKEISAALKKHVDINPIIIKLIKSLERV